MSGRIPLRNIYVMLAFAGRDVGLLSDQDIGACDFSGDFDVLARLLDSGMRRIFRRGIQRDYAELEEHGPNPRGALDINRTIGRLLHIRGELAFRVDEREPDTPANRVLRAALRAMMAEPTVGGRLTTRLRSHAARLHGVPDVSPSTALSLHARAPRGLQVYRPALRVAELCLARAIPDEAASGAAWRRLLNDEERMGELFEAFVRGFAKHSLAGLADVRVRQFKWAYARASETAVALLPSMKTDVFIGWRDGPPTIGECKFYKSPLAQAQHGGGAKLRATHLYQLTTYLRAAARVYGCTPSGLLIYARVDESIWETLELDGCPLAVVALDLVRPWEHLRKQLADALELHRPEPAAASG
jgi:5-methylcytosine-specific restriction enzyme subunit McrC